MLVDASALVAMAVNEDGARELGSSIQQHAVRLCASLGVWEAARAVARIRSVSAAMAGEAIDQLRRDFSIEVVTIGEDEARLALQVHDRYGKGTRHPAKLNMGDCFAYACAKAHGAKLLYKGNDFVHTDLA